MHPRSRPLIFVLAGVAVLALIVGMVVALLPTGSSSGSEQLADASTRTPAARATAIPTPRSVLQGAPTAATPPVYIAPIASLRIPSLNVEAKVQVKGVNAATNTMENPDGPVDVAWYGFTAKPGVGAGNAVFSGHVDYINYGKAVFWSLGDLKEGDLIEVVLEDGTVVRYGVTASRLYDLDAIPMEEVLASTSTESVTLITCGGQFSAGAYTHRLVVRAVQTEVIPATP
ncbi:MAG: class F sortase [Dehalococcoidia bacterium]|nr:class F sortase [Dehalococcoidia bacterium]MCB9485539.1 class F sortase [Thermoflexaceae bacterium]